MNENVRIITDSGCDINPAVEEKYKDLLVIMPFELTINGKGYIDRKDFTNDEFFKILKENSEIPKHSQITPIRFEEKYREGTALDRYRGIDGERAMVFFTEIHRRYPYPVFEGEKFMTEAVVWNRMAADGHKMRFYNDIIWIYEYKEDGLTKAGSRLFLNNPRGYGLWLREKAEFEHDSFMQKLHMIYTFTCDLAPQHSVRTIAQSIGAPTLLIAAIKTAHDWRAKLRRRG